MTDPFELEDEEIVEISDSEGKRSAMRLLATISFGGKKYFVLGALSEQEDGETEQGLILLREDQTIDGAHEYVITEDESEIENVVGRFVMEAVVKMIAHSEMENMQDDECPCGMKHRPGEFCVCDNTDFLQ